MRKVFVFAVAFGLLAVASADTQATEPKPAQSGQISSAELDQFGLGGMQVVSDDEGQQIRGKGFGSVFFSLHNAIVSVARQNLSPSQVYLLGRVGHKLTGYNSWR